MTEILAFPSTGSRGRPADQMTLVLDYRAADGGFRARASYRLLRAGVDVRAEPLWRLGESAITRLDA